MIRNWWDVRGRFHSSLFMQKSLKNIYLYRQINMYLEKENILCAEQKGFREKKTTWQSMPFAYSNDKCG